MITKIFFYIISFVSLLNGSEFFNDDARILYVRHSTNILIDSLGIESIQAKYLLAKSVESRYTSFKPFRSWLPNTLIIEYVGDPPGELSTNNVPQNIFTIIHKYDLRIDSVKSTENKGTFQYYLNVPEKYNELALAKYINENNENIKIIENKYYAMCGLTDVTMTEKDDQTIFYFYTSYGIMPTIIEGVYISVMGNQAKIIKRKKPNIFLNKLKYLPYRISVKMKEIIY